MLCAPPNRRAGADRGSKKVGKLKVGDRILVLERVSEEDASVLSPRDGLAGLAALSNANSNKQRLRFDSSAKPGGLAGWVSASTGEGAPAFKEDIEAALRHSLEVRSISPSSFRTFHCPRSPH